MKNYLNFTFSLILIAFACTSEKGIDQISLEDRKILVNESPFFIKGICYNPVARGETARSFKSLTEDLALMKEAGINTIRVYSPIEEKAVLDEIDKAGIKVILGFGYNQDGKFDMLSGTFIDYVNKFKGHNAILMWEVGNEYNYHPQWFEDDIRNWYSAMNEAAKLIHENDPAHPVTTAHGDLPDSLALSMGTEIDVWGMNVYRWDDPNPIYSEWEAISDKPMYLSEAGGDSYMTITKAGYEQGENEKAQADANKKILEGVFANQTIGSGVAIFAFSDELWKAGNPAVLDPGGWAPNSSGVPYDGSPNEEYWGIVDVDRNKKLAFEVVKAAYNK
jgi:beta-galactosidase/beta-glucuronidase